MSSQEWRKWQRNSAFISRQSQVPCSQTRLSFKRHIRRDPVPSHLSVFQFVSSVAKKSFSGQGSTINNLLVPGSQGLSGLKMTAKMDDAMTLLSKVTRRLSTSSRRYNLKPSRIHYVHSTRSWPVYIFCFVSSSAGNINVFFRAPFFRFSTTVDQYSICKASWKFVMGAHIDR